jgi:delta24(24(1))-sterol reductase
VETPARRRRSRKSGTGTPEVEGRTDTENETEEGSAVDEVGETNGYTSTSRRKSDKIELVNGNGSANANGYANGHANGNGHINGHAKVNRHTRTASKGDVKLSKVIDGWEEGKDPKIDHSGHKDFLGSWGVSFIMLGFPLLMYYMWIGATYYDGHFPLPEEGQGMLDFVKQMGRLVYEGAFPHLKAWTMYWVFFVFEVACYVLLPGITTKGKPLPHDGGRQLTYYCSAVWSFYTTIVVAALLHVTGLFKLYTIIDEFGPLMSVAIISGFLVALVAYISALWRGAEHRMTGDPIYDFFMGAELNPRMFGILDFKMFFEVRLPWYILLLLTGATAARQYEMFGRVSGEVGFLLMAHFLYANACSKGEELIVPTWYVVLFHSINIELWEGLLTRME